MVFCSFLRTWHRAARSIPALERCRQEEREARALIVEEFFMVDARLSPEVENMLNKHVAKIAYAVRHQDKPVER